MGPLLGRDMEVQAWEVLELGWSEVKTSPGHGSQQGLTHGALNITGVVTAPAITATVTALLPCCPQQDPSVLDMAIQQSLAGLYPPFEATAPTVLGQVFRLLESDFRGDGLNFLLDFLIPAKRLCEQVREAACVSREEPRL